MPSDALDMEEFVDGEGVRRYGGGGRWEMGSLGSTTERMPVPSDALDMEEFMDGEVGELGKGGKT